jgi:hydroxypyruvate isomerase
MKRRDFVAATVAAGLGTRVSGVGTNSAVPEPRTPSPEPRTFTLRYAPHFGMFKNSAGDDLVAQIDFMADQGFTALEDNGMRERSVADQERIAAAMTRRRMAMGVFVAHTIAWNEPGLASGEPSKREEFLRDITASVEVAKRVRATWMTVVPGRVDPRLDMSLQTANVVDALRRAADILEPHGLVMVTEALNTLRDHPGQFLSRVTQGYALCKAVRSPALKLIFDLYHQQVMEGNLIPNINATWDEVAYIQCGDHPGRKEPGTGEVNYRNVLRHIRGKGYKGILGMEHGNSIPGRAGEQAVIDAYVAADAGVS